nr:MAG TPA: hypothetical protein [Bacteriophage sp.]
MHKHKRGRCFASSFKKIVRLYCSAVVWLTVPRSGTI